MNEKPDEHYLHRALQRKVEETHLDASTLLQRFSERPTLGSTLLAINEKVNSLYADAN